MMSVKQVAQDVPGVPAKVESLKLFFLGHYSGTREKAPIPVGMQSRARGMNGSFSSQCQCDCHECAGGDTSED